MADPLSAKVLIEARDLDTDERKQVIVDGARPATEAERELELRYLIERLHPDARFRSFARDVATALDRQHLIVAHYLGVAPKGDSPAKPTLDHSAKQGELFAA